MTPRITTFCVRLVLGAAILLSAGRFGWAQGPTVDIKGPPGVPGGRPGTVAPVGSAGTSSFGSTPGSQDRPLGGRPGPSVSRAPVGGLNPPGIRARETAVRFRPRVLEPATVPR